MSGASSASRVPYVRFFELLPGALAWATLALMFFLSWRVPAFVAVFVILFDIYWLLKTVYLSLHLRSTFRAMKANLAIDWLGELEKRFPSPRGSSADPSAVSSGPNWRARLPRGQSEAEAPAKALAGGLSGSGKENASISWRELYHLVIFPLYREPYEVVRESFLSLSRAHYPKDTFIVALSVEARAGEDARRVARRIEEEFGKEFFKFFVTTHPDGLEGEIQGKGSNETWAGRKVKERIIDPLKIPYDRILVSVFDVDTQIFPEYFGRLAYVFLRAPNRLRAIYQPIPFFTNNIYQAPAFARVVSFSATFWQMMQQSRPERLTSFSSQSVPFPVLLDIGFWHTHVVSEDSRVFWQGYLAYHGDFRVEPLLYPVSMDANVAPTFWKTMRNLYRQQRRWAWGSENIPYMLEGFRTDPRIPRRKKWYWSFNALEGFHAWATNSLMIFALGWLPVFLGGRAFNYTLLSYSLPQITRFIVELSMLGIASSAIVSLLLLPPKPPWFRTHHYFLYLLQWLFIPVTLIVFGAFPALEAQTRLALGGRFRLGFWVTPKGRYPETRKGVGETREGFPV